MLTTAKIKWLASLGLAAFLLALTLLGGKWGTIEAARASVNAAPAIYSINPSAVPAGSPDKIIIISGANFGTIPGLIRIWIKDLTHDYSAAPLAVYDTAISVVVTDTLLVSPNSYLITIVRSTTETIPRIPPWVPYDEFSNSANFTVFTPRTIYLPITARH